MDSYYVKKWFKWVLAVLLACFLNYSSLFSSEATDFLKNSSFAIGAEYVYVNLHNKSTSIAPSTKFKGPCWGGTAVYEYRQSNGIYVNLNGYYIEGPFHGEGEHRRFSDLRTEFRLGHVFVLDCKEKWKLTPYAGFGFARIIQSHISQAVRGRPHITTKTPTYYVPVGVILSYAINVNFITATNIKWTPQVDATFKTSSIPHGKWILRNREGWIVELPLTYHKKWCDVDYSLTMVPYWRLLNKARGRLVTPAGVEVPIAAQRYNFYGAKLMLNVTF